jgi:hypothetical protein
VPRGQETRRNGLRDIAACKSHLVLSATSPPRLLFIS